MKYPYVLKLAVVLLSVSSARCVLDLHREWRADGGAVSDSAVTDSAGSDSSDKADALDRDDLRADRGPADSAPQRDMAGDGLSADVVPCDPVLDVDGNGRAESAADGLLISRYLFGLRGASLIADIVAGDCTRCSAVAIEADLSKKRSVLDVDDNGAADALTDGTLVARYLDGLRDADLTTDAVDTACARCTAEDIETYLDPLVCR